MCIPDLKSRAALSALALLLVPFAGPSLRAQAVDVDRLRELRDKARASGLTAEEKAEFARGMKAREAGRPVNAGKADATSPDSAAARRGAHLERQAQALEVMRQAGKQAFAAAEARVARTGPPREFFVNNETGDDSANGLAATKGADGGPVKTLAKAVSLLRPGDTLHLAVTGLPYRETLRLDDGFGGVPGQPVTIDGHGATITGCDPLRLDGWGEAGSAGLYKSAKMLSELDEADDDSRLMRVFFVFDGVMQHMGRTSKGERPAFRAPKELRPGEWTYVKAEKTFYVRVAGQLKNAKIEAPYRRNGVMIRTAKIALTDVVIKNLITVHVLNDGFNLHGSTKNLLLQNIAAYECGDDGISPHETCEVTIDGFWSMGNSTGMGNGYLSVTRASNIRLEGNLAAQFMSAHAPVTELRNAILFASAGTLPVNITNSQGSRLKMENVQISAPKGQKVLVGADAAFELRHATVVGPCWENRGTIHVSESVIAGGKVSCLEGGTWRGDGNIYDLATPLPPGEEHAVQRAVAAEVLKSPQPPFPGTGANASEFKLPPRPVPHPGAGKFTSLPP